MAESWAEVRRHGDWIRLIVLPENAKSMKFIFHEVDYGIAMWSKRDQEFSDKEIGDEVRSKRMDIVGMFAHSSLVLTAHFLYLTHFPIPHLHLSAPQNSALAFLSKKSTDPASNAKSRHK